MPSPSQQTVYMFQTEDAQLAPFSCHFSHVFDAARLCRLSLSAVVIVILDPAPTRRVASTVVQRPCQIVNSTP